jgi:hypothetical protein
MNNQRDASIDGVLLDLQGDLGISLDVLDMISMGDMPQGELISVVSRLRESIDASRLVVLYLIFDLEATRRERDQLISENGEEK